MQHHSLYSDSSWLTSSVPLFFNHGARPDSAQLLATLRLNMAALDKLRTEKMGPHPEERAIHTRIAVLRNRLMHPDT